MKNVLLLVAVLLSCISGIAQKKPGEILREKWLHQKALPVTVEKWLTEEPDTKGKFILLDFWGTSCGPCRKMIPELNALSKQLKNQLVIIGVSVNDEKTTRGMKEPVIEYSSAIDTKKVMAKGYGLNWYPMAVLIDPGGFVRWIGYPSSEKWTKDELTRLMGLYSPKSKDAKLLEDKWLNNKAADFVVEKWLTEKPDTEGKFVLIDFWGTTCGPCRKAIPELNEWSKRFADNLVVVGVAPNTEEKVRAMKEPVIEYYSAIDTKWRMSKSYGAKWAPMAVLIDPEGFVRWIGYPTMAGSILTGEVIEQIIRQYRN